MRIIPVAERGLANNFSIGGWSFEVVDMDGNRIDEVLISQKPSTPATE
jgi:CBS domain containing-hemolysin-like protein